jgi:hypothetical protein
MKQSKYQRYIADNIADAIAKIDTFTAEHTKAMRHVYSRLSRFSQQDIDTRVQMAHSVDQPTSIRGMTAFEIICWYETFNCYAQGDYYLNLEPLYKICDEEHNARYMRAVYVTKTPDEKTYNLLKSQHPQSAKAYLEYCKYMSAMKAENMDSVKIFCGEADEEWVTTETTA